MWQPRESASPPGGLETRFVAFYQAEYPGAVRLAAALTLSTAAEDVVQESFARVYRHFDRLERPAAYLHTTVVSVVHERYRRPERERRPLALLDRSPLPGPEDGSGVVDALAALPVRQRQVLVLRYWADWSEAEIANTLGCRPGTVKSLASRGLERLRKDLQWQET